MTLPNEIKNKIYLNTNIKTCIKHKKTYLLKNFNKYKFKNYLTDKTFTNNLLDYYNMDIFIFLLRSDYNNIKILEEYLEKHKIHIINDIDSHPFILYKLIKYKRFDVLEYIHQNIINNIFDYLHYYLKKSNLRILGYFFKTFCLCCSSNDFIYIIENDNKKSKLYNTFIIDTIHNKIDNFDDYSYDMFINIIVECFNNDKIIYNYYIYIYLLANIIPDTDLCIDEIIHDKKFQLDFFNSIIYNNNNNNYCFTSIFYDKIILEADDYFETNNITLYDYNIDEYLYDLKDDYVGSNVYINLFKTDNINFIKKFIQFIALRKQDIYIVIQIYNYTYNYNKELFIKNKDYFVNLKKDIKFISFIKNQK